MGRSEARSVASYLTQALIHALKVIAWPDHMAARKWRNEIGLFREEARSRFAPSMAQVLDPAAMHRRARRLVLDLDMRRPAQPLPEATDLTLAELPTACSAPTPSSPACGWPERCPGDHSAPRHCAEGCIAWMMVPSEGRRGRAPRQPGQVRKEAAVTSFSPGSLVGLPPSGALCPATPRPGGPPACRNPPPRCPQPFSVPPTRRMRPRHRASPRPPPPDGPGLFGEAFAPAVEAPILPPAPMPPPEPVAASGTPYRVLARKYRPTDLRRADRPGRAGPHAAQRLRAEPHRPCLHAHRRARRRQDHHRPHHRPRAELHRPRRQGRPDAPSPAASARNCIAILADRHPDVMEMDAASAPASTTCASCIERRALPPGRRRATRSIILDEVHMLSQRGVQRAAEDAGGAAAAREVHLRHDRDPQGADHGAVALPALRPAPDASERAARRISPASPPRRRWRSSRRRWP